MNPEDVWVIYNKITCEIKMVFAEFFLAHRTYNNLIDQAVTGTTPNKDKLIICTLARAISHITISEEENNNLEMQELIDSRWPS